MEKKYRYKTETDKMGNVSTYECWDEDFIDEDTGNVITIERHRLIEFNGDAVRFYTTSEWDAMTRNEKAEATLKSRNNSPCIKEQ